jgi:hypothetical protein
MNALDIHSEWLLATVPIVGALIIVKGTGLGVVVDTVVTICAIVALLSFAHVIDISSLIGSS